MKCKCCGEEMTAGIVLHHRCLDELLEDECTIYCRFQFDRSRCFGCPVQELRKSMGGAERE